VWALCLEARSLLDTFCCRAQFRRAFAIWASLCAYSCLRTHSHPSPPTPAPSLPGAQTFTNPITTKSLNPPGPGLQIHCHSKTYVPPTTLTRPFSPHIIPFHRCIMATRPISPRPAQRFSNYEIEFPSSNRTNSFSAIMLQRSVLRPLHFISLRIKHVICVSSATIAHTAP